MIDLKRNGREEVTVRRVTHLAPEQSTSDSQCEAFAFGRHVRALRDLASVAIVQRRHCGGTRQIVSGRDGQSGLKLMDPQRLAIDPSPIPSIPSHP